jgi:threonine/homoserine/homoserine lactone efflux protein
MSLEAWIAYFVTVFIFLVSPGPSHLFMLSKSLSHGFDKSWATGAGDLTAHIWQIGVASLGLVSFIYAFQNFFIIIKWAGVLFLIYLGTKQFRKKSPFTEYSKENVISRKKLFWQGFLMLSCQPCNVAKDMLYFLHNQTYGGGNEEIYCDTYRRRTQGPSESYIKGQTQVAKNPQCINFTWV